MKRSKRNLTTFQATLLPHLSISSLAQLVVSGTMMASVALAAQTQGSTTSNQRQVQQIEARIKEEWRQLQSASVELEATDPEAAIARYQQFFEQGAYRVPAVSVQISLRIARLWQFELRDYEKAIEIYDWALALYKNEPDAVLLQKDRLAAIEAQKKAEGGKPSDANSNTKGSNTRDAGGKASENKALPVSQEAPRVPGSFVVPAPVSGGSGSLVVTVPSRLMPGISLPNIGMSGMSAPGVALPGVGGPKMPSAVSSAALGSPATRSTTALPVKASLPLSIPHLAPQGAAFGWRPGPDSCVTALAQQKNGRIWLATEDHGVWSCDPEAPFDTRWKQFNTSSGLSDNSVYALAVDTKDRVWIGTLNHGVSVWNGQEWKNYGPLDGPLGERVFDIAICPTDGDVWLATNAGLTRYCQDKDSWSTITREDGLPTDQVQALAFDKKGNLIVGTQCEGIALSQAADSYKTWTVVAGLEQMPTTPTGRGLPANLINDVLVAKDGTVYVATINGLAWSRDGGHSWAYTRGKDYGAKVKGRMGGAPSGWSEAPGALLAEDYVTCLAEDERGRLWVGHRFAGNTALKNPSGATENQKIQLDPDSNLAGREVLGYEQAGFVRAILPLSGGRPLIARYDEGISFSQIGASAPSGAPEQVKAKEANAKEAEALKTVSQAGVPVTLPALPRKASAPTLGEIENLLHAVRLGEQQVPDGTATFLGEDWNTRGDWVGRYGTRYAMLFAMQSPLNHCVINDTNYDVLTRLGSHPYKNGESYSMQGVRHWVHRERWDDPRVLYNPLIGYRREAEIDDNGEGYPMSFEGPDLWVKVKVPAGTQRVSLYFFNKDGNTENNRGRDYLIEVKRAAENLDVAEKNPTLAQARVHDFRGGVYKSFLLQGGGEYYFVIRKNNSFNTILQAIFLDKVAGAPTGDEKRRDVWLGDVKYEAPTTEATTKLEEAALAVAAPDQKASVAAAIALWTALEGVYDKQGGQVLQKSGRLMAYRAVHSALGRTAEGEALLSAWRWRLPLWPQEDRVAFEAAMGKGWKSLIHDNPILLASTG